MSPITKRYFQLLFAEKKYALLGILLALITALSGIALLTVSGWFISATALAGVTVAGAQAFNYFAPGMVIRGLSISRTLGRYAERIVTHEATFRVISSLRAEMFETIARHYHSAERQLNSHQASSRLLEDIQHTEKLYLAAILPIIVTILSVTIYLFTLSLYLPSAALISLPFLLIGLLLLPMFHFKQVKNHQNQLHQMQSEQWVRASSLFSNLRTLTLFRRIGHMGDQLQEAGEEQLAQERSTTLRQQKIALLTQLNQGIMLLLVLWIGLSALSGQTLAGAELFMILLLTLGTLEVLATATPALTQLGLGLAALDRINQICNHPQPADQRRFVEDSKIKVEIANLAYQYPNSTQKVLESVTASLTGPNWHWICGQSGAGKSTLMALLQGRLQPSAGSISLHQPKAGTVRMMPQRCEVLRGSLRYNLCLHSQHTDEELLDTLSTAGLDAWYSTLPEGLDTWLGEGERMPSGGELKRLALARLLLQTGEIILLDEPTAGLDLDTAERIIAALREKWRDKLVIVVSHEPQLIAEQDNRIQL